VIKEPLVEH